MKIFKLKLSIFFCTILLVSCKTSKKIVIPSIGINIEQIKKDVQFLASDELEGRMVGTPGEKMAAKYCADRFKAIGLKPMSDFPEYTQNYILNIKPNPHSFTPTGDFDTQNVIGWIDNDAEHHIIIGAHYDHLGFGHYGSLWSKEPQIHNGADDNSSGTASIFALAEALQAAPKNNNYIFILFAGEEMGLWGSNYYVNHANVDLKKVNCMINLDMVGRMKPDKSLAINGTGTSPLWHKILDSYNSYDFKIIKSESGIGPSDHTSFYNNDIPVLHFFTGQHEDYHKPTDDVEKINFEGIKEISEYITGLIHVINQNGKIGFARTKDDSVDTPDFKVTLGVMPDYLFDGMGMRIDGVKEGRPAFKADMKKGDVVIKMGDIKVSDMTSYMKALGAFEPGSQVKVVIMRGGKTMEKLVDF